MVVVSGLPLYRVVCNTQAARTNVSNKEERRMKNETTAHFFTLLDRVSKEVETTQQTLVLFEQAVKLARLHTIQLRDERDTLKGVIVRLAVVFSAVQAEIGLMELTEQQATRMAKHMDVWEKSLQEIETQISGSA